MRNVPLIINKKHPLPPRSTPIGSGVTESAAKNVVNLRAKRSGQRWSVAVLQGVLTLRAQLKSDDSTGPIWQGGMGIDKSQLYGKPSEPKASPATPDLPPET